MNKNKQETKKRKRSNSVEIKTEGNVSFNPKVEEFSLENSIIEIDTSLYRNKNEIKSIKDVTNDKLCDAINRTNNEMEQIFRDNQHLMDLRIKIPFKVPKAHLIEKSVVAIQSKGLFDGIPINTKKYTKREDDLILRNFKEFCEAHKIKHDPTPFVNFVIGGRHVLSVYERLQFVRYIGKGLNDRKLYSIYKRFQLLCSTTNKGRFSSIEDQILLTYINNNNDDKQKFAKIAKILNRSKSQILKRYSTITESIENDFAKMTGIPKIEYLVSKMMEVLNISTIKELKSTELTSEFWEEISKQLDYPLYQLKRFWNASVATKLFNQNIKINKVLRKIVDTLHEKNITDWKSIDWNEICKPFERKYYTPSFIYDKFKDLRRCNIRKEYQQDPQVCIKMLKDLFSENPLLLRKIKSYEYEDGRIAKY
nr:uncharacterized protein LOC111413409 [Onthophagus taurus]